MSLAKELSERGLIQHCSAESAEAILDGEPRVVYLGVDATAEAIHVGNLVPFLLLNHLSRAGYKVIILIGGATSLIGDPSGRDTERTLASPEEVALRAAKIEAGIRKLAGDEVVFVNNYDWVSKLDAVAFLRDVGKHFTVNAMIKKESVAKRLQSEQGISFTEFSYALLQSYDFLHLYRQYGCTLQLGGSDQWGNISSGIDYVRRVEGAAVHGLTTPLIVDEVSGKKFGKSMGNAVWLDPNLTSPYDFYQFWLKVDDQSAARYLKIFTFLSLAEIEKIKTEADKDPAQRIAQKRLADELTGFIHGEKAAAACAAAASILFGNRDLAGLSDDEKAALEAYAPLFSLSAKLSVIDALLETGLASSRREGREFITSGAVEFNGQKINDENFLLEQAAYKNNLNLLKRGKRQAVLVKLVS